MTVSVKHNLFIH